MTRFHSRLVSFLGGGIALLAVTAIPVLKTVAEGVELPDDLAIVKEVGCDVVQGFIIAKPMSAEAFETWTAARPALPR